MKSSDVSVWRKRWVFRCHLKIVRDPARRLGVWSSFHRPGTVNENVLEQGCKTHFTEGHFNIMAAIKGPVVTVRLYKPYLPLLNMLLNNCLFILLLATYLSTNYILMKMYNLNAIVSRFG